MCLLCFSIDFEVNYIQGYLATDSSCIHKNSIGARNTTIKTYSLHNIIFNKNIIVILRTGLDFYLKMKSDYPNRVSPVCTSVNIHLLKTNVFPSWSILFILITKGIND